MELLLKLWNNRVLISAAGGWLFAQAIKISIEIAKGEFTPARLAEGGGMPSGHSSTVTALALSCGLTQGFDSGTLSPGRTGTMPEKLGHTVPEVLAGMAVGIFAAVLFSVWIP